MSIGENIRKRRIQLGLSQKALSKKAGASSVTFWELDKIKPQLRVLIKLAAALECNLSDLVNDNDENMEENKMNNSKKAFEVTDLVGKDIVIHEIFIQFKRKFLIKNASDDITSLFNAEIITKMQLDEISAENKNIANLIDSNILNVQCNITNTVDLYFTNIGMMCKRAEISNLDCKYVLEVFDTLHKYEFFSNMKLCFNLCEKSNGIIVHDTNVEIERNQVDQFLITIFDE